MPVGGLSLFGFLGEREAVRYLQRGCHPPNISHVDAKRQWLLAHGRLGTAHPRAGNPDLLEIPSEHSPHLDRLLLNPRYAGTIQGMVHSFKLVEPGPLLAFQFHLENDRTSQVCTGIGSPPTIAEMLPRCLPETPIGPADLLPETHTEPDGYRIVSRNKNLRVINWGPFENPPGQMIYDPNLAAFISGVTLGEGASLIQVVRFGGRCFLKNGYHRVYAFARHGARHIPCLFLEATDYRQVHNEQPGRTFDQALLESRNAPTLAHFIEDRAYPVMLRSTKREIQVRWKEDIIYE